MKKARLIAFIIRLKQTYRSGWIPFGVAETTGLSKRSYKLLFAEAKELGLIRECTNGYAILRFTAVLKKVYGNDGRYIYIADKTGGFKQIAHSVILGVAHNKIKQQFHEGGRTRGSKRGRRNTPEQSQSKVRISSRQIAKAIGVSQVMANTIINELKKGFFIKIKKPIYDKMNNYYSYCNIFNKWLCEREIQGVNEIRLDSIFPLTIPFIMNTK